MKKLVVSVFLFLIAAASFAQKNTGRVIIPESNLEFERNSDKTSVTITGFKYSSYSENKKFDGRVIEIPSKIQGLPVTAIGLGEYGYMGAFQDKGYNISGLWIPDSVKTIGVSSSENGVFNNSSFGSIRLPDGLKTITNRTFFYCSAKSINIPSSVTRIGGGAFYGCSIESVTIPKGCTIVGSDSFGFACFGRSGLKTINFPAGRVYFEASPLRVYYGETQGGIFTDCNSLTNISIPKGFEAVYRSENDFKDHTLADYISGEKLSKNFAAQDALESVKVRNVAVVDHEAYLAAYNQALKSGDYTRAMLLAKQYKEYYPYYKSSEWTIKYNEAVEKPYLDAYNKAFASKDYETAMKAAKQFKEKEPYINSSDWTKRYNDAAEKPYLDAYNKAIASKDYAKAMQTAKEFKEKNQYINSSDWTKRYEDAIEKPYLDEYNKTLASKDYTKAIQLAKEFKEKNPSIRASEWTKRYTDIAEKTYLDDYNKAAASKDWQKAKKIINEFRGKISSDSSLKSLESKWDDMLFDVDCKMYLPAYVEKLEKKGSVAKVNSNLQFKIPLTKDLYENSKFNFTDSEGNGLWTVGYTLFLKKIKEITGKDYQIYDSSSDPYLYRNASSKEIAAYHQPRKDAVKQFMENAVNASVIENVGSNSLLKIYLADNAYSYEYDSFYMTDSSGTVYTISEDDFLNYVKEVSGTEYKLYRSYYNYLYRNATEAELAAYHQPRKEVVKYFMSYAVDVAVIEKDGSNSLYKIYIANDTYNYRNKTFTLTDTSGNVYTISEDDFLSYAKEVCGMEYKLNGSYYSNSSYLYRNATEAELAAYHQVRKDAVKYFMDGAVKNGVVEKDGANHLFKIYLSDSTYSDGNSKFTVKDSSGKEYTLGKDDFLSYAKEVCGTEYKLYGNYIGSYIYRNATAEETSAYYQSKKDAVKYFMDRAVNVAVIEKDGSNLLFKIYLSDSTYNYSNSKFTVKDSSGTAYTLSDKDFLSYAKEVCGTEYNLYYKYNGSYLYRNATKEETDTFYKSRKEAIKIFMDNAVKNGTIKKDGSNLIFKFYLSDSIFDYHNGIFTVKDSKDKTYTLAKDDFLSSVKESCGIEYDMYWTHFSDCSFLFRNATAEEAAAYHQPKIDALKPFLDDVVKSLKFEEKGSNLMVKIYLPYLVGNSGDSFYLKDSSGKEYTVDCTFFLSYVKEIYGVSYNLYRNGNNGSYLYRNATDEEISAYQQPRKDAVKQFMDRALNVAVIEKDGSNFLFKIYLADDTYNSSNGLFGIIDSSGNEYILSNKDFLAYAKEVCGTEYKLQGHYYGSYLYRNATTEEVEAYYQVRKDAVKQFMERAVNVGVIEKDGSNLLFKIYLSESTYSYSNSKFTVKDSSGTAYTLSDKDFLSYAKEVCGMEYKLNGSYYSNSSYLYRNATEAELAAYHQVRKDAVKYFMEEAVKKGTVEKDSSNLLFKIYLSDSTYSYNNDTFTIKDSSGTAYTLSDKDFLSYAKEVCGMEYKLNGSYYSNSSYLYRNATEAELAAYHQVRKDAVKQFMERAVNVGVIEKDGSNLLFKIYLSESTYRNSKFTIKDSSGNAYTLSNDDFLSYAKETSGIDYKLYGSYRDPYLYAKANDMLQLKCVFAFQNGNLHTNLVYKLKDKWEFPVEFAESNGIVTIKSFKVKKSVFEENGLKAKDVVKKIVVSDAYGNETEIGWKDLPNVQAPSTLLITVVRGSGKKAQTYIVKVPVEWDVDEMKSIKDILDFKCILAFQNGTLHTNLACNVDGKWMYVAEFVESKGEVIIKSFRAKKSVLERVGLKTKDIIKKVVLIDDSENEIAVVNNLFEIQAPATLRFTVERGSGKKVQTMIFDVPVEWNEDEVKNLR